MPITLARTDVTPLAYRDPPPRRAVAPPGRDVQFVALQHAYRGRGGLTRGDSLAHRMSVAGVGSYLDLARRIVGGQLFSFQWHKDFWLPLFQFHPERLEPLEAPRRVLAELRGALDGWAVASWYVTPSLALDGETPLAVLDVDLPAVLAVAHAERVARRS
jgi:hypothetical protein